MIGPGDPAGDGGRAAPLIVTALFGAADFAFFDGQRRAHFPADRNQVPAHLTLFHHLAPSLEDELRHRLTLATRGQGAPPARIAGVIALGRGVAYRIHCAGLDAIRDELADAFAPMLMPQDRTGWRPHVTIQNKVEPGEARALHAALSAGFRPRAVAIAGLACWRYRGGPWDAISRHMFA